jgi:hypothetical protein
VLVLDARRPMKQHTKRGSHNYDALERRKGLVGPTEMSLKELENRAQALRVMWDELHEQVAAKWKNLSGGERLLAANPTIAQDWATGANGATFLPSCWFPSCVWTGCSSAWSSASRR